MTAADRRTHVLIAGGGIAALELLLALRVLAGPHVAVTLLTRDAEPTRAGRARSGRARAPVPGRSGHDARAMTLAYALMAR